MASISLTVTNTNSNNELPDNITAGVAAPTTANSIELRIDLAGGWSSVEVHRALIALQNRLVDGRFTEGAKLVTPGV